MILIYFSSHKIEQSKLQKHPKQNKHLSQSNMKLSIIFCTFALAATSANAALRGATSAKRSLQAQKTSKNGMGYIMNGGTTETVPVASPQITCPTGQEPYWANNQWACTTSRSSGSNNLVSPNPNNPGTVIINPNSSGNSQQQGGTVGGTANTPIYLTGEQSPNNGHGVTTTMTVGTPNGSSTSQQQQQVPGVSTTTVSTTNGEITYFSNTGTKSAPQGNPDQP